MVEASRTTDSKNCFPSICSCESRVKLVCELHPVLILIVLWVKEKVSVRLLGKLTESLNILKLSFAISENKQVNVYLPMCKFRGSVSKKRIC